MIFFRSIFFFRSLTKIFDLRENILVKSCVGQISASVYSPNVAQLLETIYEYRGNLRLYENFPINSVDSKKEKISLRLWYWSRWNIFETVATSERFRIIWSVITLCKQSNHQNSMTIQRMFLLIITDYQIIFL